MSKDDEAFEAALQLERDGDHSGARSAFRKLAAANHPKALVNLAYFEERGIGGPVDHASRLFHLKTAAEQDDPLAINALILLLADQGSYAEARKLVERGREIAADLYPTNLAILDIRERRNDREVEEAVSTLRRESEESSLAAWWLGICLEEGRGVGQNRVEAREIFQRLADEGSDLGRYQLGLWRLGCLDDQEPTPEEVASGIELLRLAADSGMVSACAYLGEVFAMGLFDLERDVDQALPWLDVGVSYGEPRAIYVKAVLAHQNHIEFEQDLVAPLRQAAASGEPGAQFLMGIWCLEGKGMARRPREARRWFRAAAMQGDEGGQLLLEREYLQMPWWRRWWCRMIDGRSSDLETRRYPSPGPPRAV